MTGPHKDLTSEDAKSSRRSARCRTTSASDELSETEDAVRAAAEDEADADALEEPVFDRAKLMPKII